MVIQRFRSLSSAGHATWRLAHIGRTDIKLRMHPPSVVGLDNPVRGIE